MQREARRCPPPSLCTPNPCLHVPRAQVSVNRDQPFFLVQLPKACAALLDWTQSETVSSSFGSWLSLFYPKHQNKGNRSRDGPPNCPASSEARVPYFLLSLSASDDSRAGKSTTDKQRHRAAAVMTGVFKRLYDWLLSLFWYAIPRLYYPFCLPRRCASPPVSSVAI